MMKTNINQIFTIVGFFTTTIALTVAISLGMTNLIIEPAHNKNFNEKKIMIKQVKKKIDLRHSLKLLVPRVK